MHAAIGLCIKDLRRYWLYILIIELLAILRALLDILLPLYPQLFSLNSNEIWELMSLACGFIVVLAVQADSLVGSRQFWLTRPISWKSLLAAKILFLICVANLPVLLAQSAAMIANNLSPIEHLSRLVWMQLHLTAVCLVAALIASITQNLKQAAIFVVAGFAALILIQLSYKHPISSSWRSADFPHESLLAALAILIASTLLWVQYSQRALKPAIIFIFSVLLSAFLLFAPVDSVLWGSLALLRARMAGMYLRNSPISITFRPENYFKKTNSRILTSNEDAAILVLPVHVEGIPKDRQLVSERIKFSVSAPDGRKWESGWEDLWEIIRISSSPQKSAVVRSDGDYLMSAKLNWQLYERVHLIPAHIRARLTFDLFGPPVQIKCTSNRMTALNNSKTLRAGCFQQRQLKLFCIFSKLQFLKIDDKFTEPAFYNHDYQIGLIYYSTNYGSGSSIWGYESVDVPPSEAVQDVVWAREEEAWTETTLDMPGIRLSDYFKYRIKR
jgi:hypothetical protein